MSSLLLLGLFLGPLGLGHSEAAGGLSQTAMAAADQGNSNPADFGVPVAHCVAAFCASSFMAGAHAGPRAGDDGAALSGRPDNDRLVRSLYLDREPPVPKISLS